MIKIEITDIENIDKRTLIATGEYLIDLGKIRNPEEMIDELKDTSKRLADAYAEKTEDVERERSVDEQLDMQQLPGVREFAEAVHAGARISEVMNDIIEEELIPSPPEVVNIPPLASDVFNPVNALPLPPGYAPPKVELDIHGLPWDMRIHARTKTKMKDGSWKKLRGVGPEILKKVESQLQAVQNIPAPPASVPVAPVVGGTGEVAAPGFSDLMTIVTKAITEGKLKRDQVTDVLKPFGIPSLPLVSTRLDLIPAIITAIQGVINAPC